MVMEGADKLCGVGKGRVVAVEELAGHIPLDVPKHLATMSIRSKKLWHALKTGFP